MTRKYEMRKRADRVAETRRRIVEAAIELHADIGPARTSASAIAERAGVERQTYYRHFPEERALHAACSGLYMERNPIPDPSDWPASGSPRDRLRHALSSLYAYYEANERMLASVTRDAEHHSITRDALAGQVDPKIKRIESSLAAFLGRDKRTKAAIGLAVDFGTWRSLTGPGGLTSRKAADLMAGMLSCEG